MKKFSFMTAYESGRITLHKFLIYHKQCHLGIHIPHLLIKFLFNVDTKTIINIFICLIYELCEQEKLVISFLEFPFHILS